MVILIKVKVLMKIYQKPYVKSFKNNFNKNKKLIIPKSVMKTFQLGCTFYTNWHVKFLDPYIDIQQSLKFKFQMYKQIFITEPYTYVYKF